MQYILLSNWMMVFSVQIYFNVKKHKETYLIHLYLHTAQVIFIRYVTILCKIDFLEILCISRWECDIRSVLVPRGRKGDDALREAVSHQVAQLHELETEGRDWVDPGGRHEPHHPVGLRLNRLHVTTLPFQEQQKK